jgi:hypothetical protein
MNNVRCEVSGTFRNKSGNICLTKLKELEIKSKNNIIGDMYRGMNEFKKGCQHRTQ